MDIVKGMIDDLWGGKALADSLIRAIAGSIVLIWDWVPIIVAPSDPGPRLPRRDDDCK